MLQFNYKYETDTLYALEDREFDCVYNIQKTDGLTIRYDLETHEPVGFVVENYMKLTKLGYISQIEYLKNLDLPVYATKDEF
jgi:hypothetical protein